MGRWGFGLRQMFVLVAVVGFSLVALRSATATWVSAMLALTVMLLTVSLLLLIFRRGSQRAFWIGFATCGWMYLLLLLLSWTLGRNTSNDSPLRARSLVTQQLASAAYHWLYDEALEKYNGLLAATTTGVPDGGTVLFGGGSDSMGLEMAASPTVGGAPMPMGISFGAPVGPPPGPNESDFVNVAHALWTLLFAVMGGCLAYWLYLTGPGRNEATASVDGRLSAS